MTLLLSYVLSWSMISLVYGDVFTVPTAFLARKHHGNQVLWESPIDIRGGGPKGFGKEKNEEVEWEETYDGNQEKEVGDVDTDALAEDVESEVEIQEVDEEDELAEATIEEETELSVEDETSETVAEETVIEDVIKEDDTEVATLEERVTVDYSDDEDSLSFIDSMEARIANTNTDDENSSAFVDRMELADAYDEVDTTADPEEDTSLAAVTAATVIGGGESNDVDAEDEVLAEEETSGGSTVDTVAPLSISIEIKDTLKGLKYKYHEIEKLRPEVATELAEKGLQRPQEGIPKNWLVEGASNGVFVRERALKLSALLAALGGLAFVGINGNIIGFIASVPSVLKSILPSKAMPVEEATTSPISETEMSTEEEEEDDHAHSVKPNSTSAPAYEMDLDKSLLDKVITRVGNVLKAFWNAKI